MKELDAKEYIENKIFLDDPQPISYYRFLPKTLYLLDLEKHWSSKVHFIYIVSGTKRYTIGGVAYMVKEGDILYIPPNVVHASGKTGKITDQNFEVIIVAFDPDLLLPQNNDKRIMKILNPIKNAEALIPNHIQPKDTIYQAIKDGFDAVCDAYIKRKPAYELEIQQHLLYIFTVLYRCYALNDDERGQKEECRKDQINKAIQYIHENYCEDLNIDVLAKITGFSSPHFMNLFKQYYGVTCVSYINLYRLDKAAYKLINTDEPIKEIALKCGYNNVSFFNRVFKKQFGETPRQFRTKILKQEIAAE